MRVIDVQAHVVPRVYLERLVDRSGYPRAERAGDKWWLCSGPALRTPVSPAMTDMDVRLRDMDAAGVDVQLLSTTLPGVEMFADPSFGVELARSANDDLAALVHASPDRFLGMAALPLQAPAAARDELRRATQELGFSCSPRGDTAVSDQTHRLRIRTHAERLAERRRVALAGTAAAVGGRRQPGSRGGANDPWAWSASCSGPIIRSGIRVTR